MIAGARVNSRVYSIQTSLPAMRVHAQMNYAFVMRSAMHWARAQKPALCLGTRGGGQKQNVRLPLTRLIAPVVTTCLLRLRRHRCGSSGIYNVLALYRYNMCALCRAAVRSLPSERL